jgi:signal transduction histidine kinase
MSRYALIAALLMAFSGTLYGKGRVDGKHALAARIAAAVEGQREAVAKMETQRLLIEAERDRMARELEDLANADPVLVPQCLFVDRVRRVDSIQ